MLRAFTSLFPATQALLATVIIWLLYSTWRAYQRQVKMSRAIDLIPGPQVPSFLLGHLSWLWPTQGKADWYQQMFNTFIGIAKIYQLQSIGFLRLWIGPTQPMVVIFDGECAESLLMSNANITKSKEYDLSIPWLGLSLLTSTGDFWRAHRKMLTPAFHFRILESFLPIILRQQSVMQDIIERRMDSDGVIDDIRPIISNCSLDIICETAMGVNVNAQTDSESPYLLAVRRVLELFTLRFLSPWLWNDAVFQLTPTGFEQRRTIKFLHDFTMSVIKQRKQEIVEKMRIEAEMGTSGKKRVLVFLDALLTQNLKDTAVLSDEDIRAEVDTFMAAGQETSSATVQFALQLIGNHPEVQAKIQEELDSIYADEPDREIEFDDLPKMKYMEKCIQETLRLFPPVMCIARHSTEEFSIKGHAIPAGTTCMVLFYQMHRDPKYFPNPERFDPERFSPENTNGRYTFAYTPFSAGPRNCIGKRFAMQTTKALIGSILRKYTITSMVPMDKVELAIGMTIGPKNKLTIKFEPRC